MLILEAFFKFGAIGVMLALAVLILRDGRDITAFKFSLLLIASMICLFLASGSDELTVSGPLRTALRLVDMLSTLFIWWLGLALFDDEFKLGPFEWGVAALYVPLALCNRLFYMGIDFIWVPGLDIVWVIFSLALMAHLIYRAVQGRHDDLIERRRRVRIWFAVAVALVLVISIVAERIVMALDLNAQPTIWITYVFTLPLTVWAVLWLTRLHPEALAFEGKPARSLGQQKAASELDPRDLQVRDNLMDLMQQDRVFTEHGLTIGRVAEQLGIPAHQLRLIINRSMGYKNFSSFLNFYRIEDVKQSLHDPENSRIPVLTLALDSGFSSLAPFNKAFKAATGVTPTEFRSEKLDKMSTKAD